MKPTLGYAITSESKIYIDWQATPCSVWCPPYAGYATDTSARDVRTGTREHVAGTSAVRPRTPGTNAASAHAARRGWGGAPGREYPSAPDAQARTCQSAGAQGKAETGEGP